MFLGSGGNVLGRTRATLMDSTSSHLGRQARNVAKCDIWCELQNPVNHRVFEPKLRPKPSG
ncbi:unnamed protein product [Brassica rapa subsp. narinosa]